MEEQQKNTNESGLQEELPEIITPWYILDILKPIIREEFIALCRYDRTGIRMKFCNGQKFHLTVTEIN